MRVPTSPLPFGKFWDLFPRPLLPLEPTGNAGILKTTFDFDEPIFQQLRKQTLEFVEERLIIWQDEEEGNNSE